MATTVAAAAPARAGEPQASSPSSPSRPPLPSPLPPGVVFEDGLLKVRRIRKEERKKQGAGSKRGAKKKKTPLSFSSCPLVASFFFDLFSFLSGLFLFMINKNKQSIFGWTWPGIEWGEAPGPRHTYYEVREKSKERERERKERREAVTFFLSFQFFFSLSLSSSSSSSLSFRSLFWFPPPPPPPTPPSTNKPSVPPIPPRRRPRPLLPHPGRGQGVVAPAYRPRRDRLLPARRGRRLRLAQRPVLGRGQESPRQREGALRRRHAASPGRGGGAPCSHRPEGDGGNRVPFVQRGRPGGEDERNDARKNGRERGRRRRRRRRRGRRFSVRARLRRGEGPRMGSRRGQGDAAGGLREARERSQGPAREP